MTWKVDLVINQVRENWFQVSVFKDNLQITVNGKTPEQCETLAHRVVDALNQSEPPTPPLSAEQVLSDITGIPVYRIPTEDNGEYVTKQTCLQAMHQFRNQGIDHSTLVRKIEIHIETTEECMDNFDIPDYVKELLKQDNQLLKEIQQQLNGK